MKPWILAARPKTLPAAVIPVLIGSALAWNVGAFAWLPALICLLFAMLIQIGTNFANDFFDFIKGADGEHRLGPSRAVASGWIKPESMRRAMWITFGLAFLTGLSLVYWGGWFLVLVGIASVLCGIGYTGGPYPLGYHGWGEFFVFIFFGFVATGFTYYVQSGSFFLSREMGTDPVFRWFGVWVAGVIPGALSTNLLVVNNYRDAPLDAEAGKRTLVVRLGKRFGEVEYILGLSSVVIVPLLFYWAGHSLTVLLPVLVLPLGLRTLRQMKVAEERESFDQVLKNTAVIMISSGVLFSIGLVA